jgi:hypothetical protein
MNTKINKKLPPYIPTREAQLLVWIEQFLNALKPMLALFDIEQQDYEILANDFEVLRDAYNCNVNSHDVAAANAKYKDLALYDRNHQQATAPRSEEKIFPSSSSLEGGYVWRLVELVNSKILPSPRYSADIGNQLHIVAPASQPVNWTTVQPTLAAVNDEAGVHLGWGRGEAEGVLLEVNRNDGKGWQFLNIVSRAAYTDRAGQPPTPTVWKYRASYRHQDQNVGKVSAEVEVIAQEKSVS